MCIDMHTWLQNWPLLHGLAGTVAQLAGTECYPGLLMPALLLGWTDHTEAFLLLQCCLPSRTYSAAPEYLQHGIKHLYLRVRISKIPNMIHRYQEEYDRGKRGCDQFLK